jgi:large subunit ribosomal protein L18
MYTPVNKNEQRIKRHGRSRVHLVGTTARPRLNVFRSNKAIYCQIIDDTVGTTLVSASSLEVKDLVGSNIAGAKVVGKLIAEKALAKGVKAVIFDRGGYIYHGRVKALAEAAREAGLEF